MKLPLFAALATAAVHAFSASFLTPHGSHVVARPACRPTPNDLRQYTGRFGLGGEGGESVLVVDVRDGELTIRPLLWSGLALLERVGTDSFLAVHDRRPGARFRRDAKGCVTGLDLLGVSPGGYHVRLPDDQRWPIEDLVSGRARQAARRFQRLDSVSTERLIAVAQRVSRMPSRASYAADFLSELAQLRPTSAAIHSALGDALIAVGRRDLANAAYARALRLDSADVNARGALVRTGALAAPEANGWKLPFTLAELFAEPTQSEIDDVLATWRTRDLSPKNVQVISRHQISLDGIPAEARIVTHEVLGSRHTGVIIVPATATPGPRPILVEAKGVSPSFPALDIPGSLTSPFVLADKRGDVIYVVPGYRGEWVTVGSDSIRSEGDRSNAWDGAADDLIALLNVAKQITPEADTSHVCAFGRSRGGAVVLLAGARDPSIDCVVSWAAPTEWLQLMGTEGWRQEELVADGLRRRSVPGDIGGQFIDYFLKNAIDGKEDLAASRRRIIGSGVIHFADRVPLAQTHWSEDDPSVPVINGRAFVRRWQAARRPALCLDARFHADAGHDQDRQRAPRQSREFLLRGLAMPDSSVARCRVFQ